MVMIARPNAAATPGGPSVPTAIAPHPAKTRAKVPIASATRAGPSGRPSIGDGGAPAATGGPQGDLDERPDPLGDLEIRLPEGGQPLGVVALDLGRVLEAPVERVVGAREDGARLARPVAHGDDVVERLTGELVDRLAPRAAASRSRRRRGPATCTG